MVVADARTAQPIYAGAELALRTAHSGRKPGGVSVRFMAWTTSSGPAAARPDRPAACRRSPDVLLLALSGLSVGGSVVR